MSELVQFLSNVILGDLSPFSKSRHFLSVRFLANIGAFFFLVFGYVLGCRALYNYFLPQLGEVNTLLVLCAVLVLTSLFLFFVSWLMKPKESAVHEMVRNVEKAITDMPSNISVKNIISRFSTKTIATIFALAVVTSFLTKSGKKLLFDNNTHGGQHGKRTFNDPNEA
jgi:hypothetical protein